MKSEFSLAAKFMLIGAAAGLVSLLGYDVLVEQMIVTRLLFGLQPRLAAARPPAALPRPR